MDAEFERLSDAKNPPSASKYWLIELENAEKAEEEYRRQASRLNKIYENVDSESVEFNIFWSNVETLKPATYSKRPSPDIRQRKQFKDPIGRDGAQIIEMAVKHCTDSTAGYDYDAQKEYMRDEMLITGRGLTRIEYTASVVDSIDPITQQPTKIVANQKVREKAIGRDDFRMSPAATWDDVRWLAFRHKPTRDELEAQFPEHGSKVPLNHSLISEGIVEKHGEKDNDTFRRADVWEIWDKVERKRVWVAKDYDKILYEEPDPYKLEDFFPMARPLYAFTIPGTMIPKAEYLIYEEQAEVVNATSVRIREITKGIKVKAAYPSIAKEIKDLAEAANGAMIPLEIALGTNINEIMVWWPIEKMIAALPVLYQARAEAIQVIYQVTGISDIMRGSTNPNETAAAQKLKGNFGNLRMNPRTMPMQRHCRDSYKIIAELIAEHFTSETLTNIYGQPIPPEIIAMLRNDKLRTFSIDIETDSTVQPDADTDKQQRIEFITAVTGFLKEMAPLVMQGAIPPDVAKAMLTFGIRGFKTGRELEDAIDTIGSQQATPQPPPPDPEMEKMKAESQLKMTEMQKDAALQKYKVDTEARTKLQVAGMNSQQRQAEQSYNRGE